MRRSEWIAAGYFVYLLAPIWVSRLRRTRFELALWALALAGAVSVVSQLPETSPWRAVRDWAPGLYLLGGYWLPGRLFTAPNEGLERWLLVIDRSWLGLGPDGGTVGATARVPRWAGHYLELAYLLCYPLVPIAFGLLYFAAEDWPGASSMADDFWSAVLVAVFICYGLLPWLPTRPPRALMSGQAIAGRSPVRRLNLVVLNHASIQVNTFPSGHVAAALAAALATGQVLPAGGVILGLLAISIAVAAVLGRYHYTADVILGALVAVFAFAVTR